LNTHKFDELIETARALQETKGRTDQEELYDDEDLPPHHYGSDGEGIIN
jgi:hypothetical protein